MVYSVEIQKNMKQLRKAFGISQEEAALRAGLSRVHWQKIESGYENITVDTLRSIALVFGVSPLALGIFSWPGSKILSALHIKIHRVSAKVCSNWPKYYLDKERAKIHTETAGTYGPC